MGDLLKLAERCEAATGPERGLDCWIENHLGLARFVEDRPDPHSEGWLQKRVEPKPYTASLDAAMTLVPGEWCRIEHGKYVGGGEVGADCWCSITYPDWEGDEPDVEVENCSTPALALCAAALRARAASADRNPEGEDLQGLRAEHESAVPREDGADAQ